MDNPIFCISKIDQNRCTGCSSCSNICPTHAISMQPNIEGFLYPIINDTLCTVCGLCGRHCPETSKLERTAIPQFCYTARHKDDHILMQSSSGGAFTAITQCVKPETHIFGAAYDDNNKVRHIGILVEQGISDLRGSKYVQSNMNEVYKEIRSLLQKKKQVIFSGTPCQIAGLKAFLHQKEDTLLCVELLCHGVASPKVFADYITAIERKYRKKIETFTFRYKKQGKGMWEDFLTFISFKKGKKIFKRYDLFTYGFLQRLFLRRCCGTCTYADKNRVGDIIIADFWGLKKYRPDLYSNKGVSLVIPVSKKGMKLLQEMRSYMFMEQLDITWAIEGNGILNKPQAANLKRDDFFYMYQKEGIIKAMHSFVKSPSVSRRIFSLLPDRMKTLLRKLLI